MTIEHAIRTSNAAAQGLTLAHAQLGATNHLVNGCALALARDQVIDGAELWQAVHACQLHQCAASELQMPVQVACSPSMGAVKHGAWRAGTCCEGQLQSGLVAA